MAWRNVTMSSLKASARGLSAAVITVLIVVAPLRATDMALPGRELFQRCAACHLPDGTGVPGSFPPLAGRLGALVGIPRGRDYLVLVVQTGLMGDLEIERTEYRGVMPAQGPGLGNEGLAEVLNYVMLTFNAKTLPHKWRKFTSSEVAQINARYPNLNAAQLQKLRADLFGVH